MASAVLVLALAAAAGAQAPPPPDSRFCPAGTPCEPVRLLLAGDATATVELYRATGGECVDAHRRPAATIDLTPAEREKTLLLPRTERGSWRAVVAPGREAECAVYGESASAAVDSAAPHELRFLRPKRSSSLHGVVAELESRLKEGVAVEIRPAGSSPCVAVRECRRAATVPNQPPEAVAAPSPRVDHTDSGGRFRFDDLAPGEWVVSIPGQNPPVRMTLSLPEGKNLDLGGIPERLFGTIQGSVDERADVAEIDDVLLYPVGAEGAPVEPVVVAERQFRVDDVPPGRYVLFGRKEGAVKLGERVDVKAGRELSVALRRPVVTISGKLTTGGQPAEGEICLFDREGAAARCVSTEGTAPFELAALAGERSLTALVRLADPPGRVTAQPVPATAEGAGSSWSVDVPSSEQVLRFRWADGRPLDGSFRVTLLRGREERPVATAHFLPGGFATFRGPFGKGSYRCRIEGRDRDGELQRDFDLAAGWGEKGGGYTELTLDLWSGRPILLVDGTGWPLGGATLGWTDPKGGWHFEPADGEGKVVVRTKVDLDGELWILARGRAPGRGRRWSRADDDTPRLVFDEPPGRSLGFELRDLTGGPIAGARIELSGGGMPAEVLRQYLEVAGAKGMTDAEGRVRFPMLPDGDWKGAAVVAAGTPVEIRFAPAAIELTGDVDLPFDLDTAVSGH